MARPTNLKGRNNSEGSVNGPQMSQQSNSSDDSWVTYQSDSSDAFDASFRALALVKNFQAKSDKKEKEEQNHIIQGVEVQFAKTKRETMGHIRGKLQSLAELHAAFSTEVAEIDDQIRSVWVQIGEEHNKFLKFASHHKELATALESERMKWHIDSLAKQKHAFETYEAVYDALAKPFPTER